MASIPLLLSFIFTLPSLLFFFPVSSSHLFSFSSPILSYIFLFCFPFFFLSCFLLISSCFPLLSLPLCSFPFIFSPLPSSFLFLSLLCSFVSPPLLSSLVSYPLLSRLFPFLSSLVSSPPLLSLSSTCFIPTSPLLSCFLSFSFLLGLLLFNFLLPPLFS